MDHNLHWTLCQFENLDHKNSSEQLDLTNKVYQKGIISIQLIQKVQEQISMVMALFILRQLTSPFQEQKKILQIKNSMTLKKHWELELAHTTNN